MYCKKCGKKIEYDSDVCYECQRDEMLFGQSTNAGATKMPNAMDDKIDKGTGKAIASVILGATGAELSIVAYALIILLFALTLGRLSAVMECILIISGGLVTSILGLVFGIKSIKKFIKVKNEYGVKPVATLVLGIAGTATGGFGIFFSFLSLIVSMITMAI